MTISFPRTLLLAVIFLLLTPVLFASARAPYVEPLSGHAWSSTIGWISFDGPGYGVVIEPVTGDIYGYAWSSTIGWIKFGGLENFPSGGGDNARIDLVTGAVAGWARACAATVNADCTGAVDPNAGDWDGWISLSCTNTGGCGAGDYGLTTTSITPTHGSFSGYAWGSLVIGWIDFSRVIYQPPCTGGLQCRPDLSGNIERNMWCEEVGTNDCPATQSCVVGAPLTCTGAPVGPGSGSVTILPPVVRPGGVVEVTWAANNPASCTLRQQNPGGVVLRTWSGLVGPTGTQDSDPINARTVFSLECIDTLGATVEVASTTVRVLPNLIES